MPDKLAALGAATPNCHRDTISGRAPIKEPPMRSSFTIPMVVAVALGCSGTEPVAPAESDTFPTMNVTDRLPKGATAIFLVPSGEVGLVGGSNSITFVPQAIENVDVTVKGCSGFPTTTIQSQSIVLGGPVTLPPT